MRFRGGLVSFGLCLLLFGGCSERAVPSPFPSLGAAGAAGADPGSDGVINRQPGIGGPCTQDAQCDDGIACTVDTCDNALGRCRFAPSDALCLDDVFCNGREVCDTRAGCRPGEPISCSDSNACTVSLCIEATRSCETRPRDADGDGDPPWNCEGGGDCDDNDPHVSSFAQEICGNGKDDNCDGLVDERGCRPSAHDTCADPFVITASGSYELDLAAAQRNFGFSCVSAQDNFRDVVVAISVPEGPARDVDIVASAPTGRLALAAASTCGNAATETRCTEGLRLSGNRTVARTTLRGLAEGAHPLYVLGTIGGPVVLDVTFDPPSVPTSHDTCALSLPLEAGRAELVWLADAGETLDIACAGSPRVGERVYRFTLEEPKDVRLYAASVDGLGMPLLSLRSEACAALDNATAMVSSELTCRLGENAELFARLSAGTYYVAVSAFGPTVVSLALELSAATSAPVGDACEGAPPISLQRSELWPLSGHEDSVQESCLPGSVDAARSLVLERASDLLLIAQASLGDVTALGLFDRRCDAVSDRLRCEVSPYSPLRLSAQGLPKGDYRVVFESLLGSSGTLTALVRPASAPIAVVGADDCQSAFVIGQAGGTYFGNTGAANADYDASCALGGGAQGGAPDQLLKLSLSQKSRVVLDAARSSYLVVLSVRGGAACPGAELPGACSASFVDSVVVRSFLDLVLDPGDYFIQIDGVSANLAAGSGQWVLDAFVLPAD